MKNGCAGIAAADVNSLRGQRIPQHLHLSNNGLSHEPWGEDLDVPDPFGNRLIFHTPRR